MDTLLFNLQVVLVVLVTSVMACAQSTTQPVVVVRNTDTQTDTTLSVTENATLYQSQIPKNWTLDYNYGLTGGHTAQTSYTVDGGSIHACWTPPYNPLGHNVAMNLPVGSHTVQVTVNGISLPPLAFVVLPKPPVVPTGAAQWGWNIPFGASDPTSDPKAHPQILSLLKATSAPAVRLWLEDDQWTKLGDSYWTICRAYKDAGIHVFLVYQGYQYASPKYSMPPDSRLTAVAKGIPANAGVTWFCLGNEVNTSDYYKGTLVQLVHAATIMAPLLHASQIQFIAPSVLNNTNWLATNAPAFKTAGCDALDYHSYHNTTAQVLGDVQNYTPVLIKVGMPGFLSEWGTRPGGTPGQWAVSQQGVAEGLKKENLWVFPFPAVGTPTDTLDTTSPLTASYGPHEPYYSMWVSTLGK